MAETLITSSVLIMGICLIRFLLKGRISPQVQYGLWSVAALRLCFPLLYPFFGRLKNLQSRFSVMNAAESVRENVSAGTKLTPAAVHLAAGQVNPADQAVLAGKTAGTDWLFIILMIWVSVSILLFVWMVCMNLHFSRRLYFQRERYKGNTDGITKLPVYCVKNLASPCFVAYLGDKAIYLPERMAKEPEKVRYVLVHEDCHALHHDHIWSALRCILLCVYWVNPLVWAAAFLSKRDCELACDAAAVKRLGEEERFAYGRVLIDLASDKKYAPGFFSVPSELNNGKGAMKERIITLAKDPRMTRITSILIPAALVVLVLCTYTGQNTQREIYVRSGQWAEAFCDRDGQSLKAMYNPEHLDDFYQIDLVQSEPGDDFVSFGWSSPWPMDGQYRVYSDNGVTELTYYAMTSDPHRWVWKEWLTWKKVRGTWYVDQEVFEEYDQIVSADEFKEAYGGKISDTAMDYRKDGMSEALNEMAKSDPVYQDLFVPERAMEYLLNLHGGYGIALTAGSTTTVVYTFSDGSRSAVTMIQPHGSDGIWIPEEITSIPEALQNQQADAASVETASQTAAEEHSGRITSYDVVRLAGVSTMEQLDLMTKGFPKPDSISGNNETPDVIKRYEFPYGEDNYELLIAYGNADDSLQYIAVQRLSTGEWITIYETPENTAQYGIELSDEQGIREFFETHKSMEDYLTYHLPDGLANGGYLATMETGGNLFLTSDPEGINRLEELSRYIDEESVPAEWRAAGAVKRYDGTGVTGGIEKGSLMGLPWNHTSILSEPVSIADCEVPALIILVQHDLYTPAALEEAEAEYGPISEENKTSRMWYVFFAKEDSDKMYSVSLNADLYQRDDALKMARSVHFKDGAF
ncbi:hypothetical protein C0033_19575 [Clostridium sp. chh4-2]|uniref:M56 family metallopeptidase n=1 Tax=Clostridium sp. chh4-2 TaxID=2067550 RepID=UPI000CCE749A|nr:M56 family metallopeptidase [Clostridium sp. chh4-2]PNV60247.1 hypothetical protein C0033_19575 [Clostridium sp. chh4-2]